LQYQLVIKISPGVYPEALEGVEMTCEQRNALLALKP